MLHEIMIEIQITTYKLQPSKWKLSCRMRHKIHIAHQNVISTTQIIQNSTTVYSILEKIDRRLSDYILSGNGHI